ncbi:MAG: DUF3330 domain-containing protein [Burkholderiales bacterium]
MLRRVNATKSKTAYRGRELLSCEMCCKEISQSEALNAEAADYIYHFCGPECFAKFGAAGSPQRGRVSVFQVRLRCEAAPKIGCGLRAKPVLRDLEGTAGIGEAWLNGAGNLLAVVRTAARLGADAVDPALAAFRKHRISAKALRGEQFAAAVADFAARSGWHREADVDRLSAEEARIIAARFVARMRAETVLPESRANALESAVAEACARELIQNPAQSAAARKRRLASAALEVGRTQLDALAYSVFSNAVGLGHRPLPGER